MSIKNPEAKKKKEFWGTNETITLEIRNKE